MYSRLLTPPTRSFFLFGPRGTGKSSWAGAHLENAVWFDLLDARVYTELLGDPTRIERRVPPDHRGWIVVDEVQRAPSVLDEVHRLIETRGWRFALTGSSARKLRRGGTNLLAGRAVRRTMHPLTRRELGADFDLATSLRFGNLPFVQTHREPREAREYLDAYVATYLREEVLQEGVTRRPESFTRFHESAAYSQAAPLNVSAVAAECGIGRKSAEAWFEVLEDLLLAARLPAFTRRARRRVVAHPKFFYFDVGVFRTLRPRGPLDTDAEIDGPAFETLLYQEIRAHNEVHCLGYTLHWWRTHDGREVDLVLYGERGLRAFEVKRTSRLRGEDFRGLTAFLDEYPEASGVLVHGGDRAYHEGPIRVVPMQVCLDEMEAML